MVLTNPSRSSFASYLHRTSQGSLGRDFNGLIFSVYSEKRYPNFDSFAKINDYEKTYYIGILGNFFKTPTL